MNRSKFSDQQIAFALRQAETGTRVSEICRKFGIARQRSIPGRRSPVVWASLNSGRKLPRQGDSSKVEFRARFAYSSGLRSPSESWGHVSL